MLRVPRPAPKRCSPAAAAVASLSSTAGRPSSADASSTIGTSAQPGQVQRRDQDAARASRAARRSRSRRPRSRPTRRPPRDRAAARARTAARARPRARARRRSARRRTRDAPSRRRRRRRASCRRCRARAASLRAAAPSPTAPSARRRHAYPLRPWTAMPRMKYFWNTAKRITIGRIEQQRPGHDHLVVALAAAAGVEPVEQDLHPERRREQRLVAQVDQRRDQVEPLRLDLEDERHDQRRLRERQRDAPEHREVAVAVHPRGLEVVARDAQEELSLQEDVERAAEHVRHPERVLRVRADVRQERVVERELADRGSRAGRPGSSSPRPAASSSRAGRRRRSSGAGSGSTRTRTRRSRSRTSSARAPRTLIQMLFHIQRATGATLKSFCGTGSACSRR